MNTVNFFNNEILDKILNSGPLLIAVLTPLSFFIKFLIQYFNSLSYSDFYKIPDKYFNEVNWKKIFEDTLIFILGVFLLIFLILIISKEINDSKKVNLIVYVYIFILIFFASFIEFMRIGLKYRDCLIKENIYKDIYSVFFSLFITGLMVFVIIMYMETQCKISEYITYLLLFVILIFIIKTPINLIMILSKNRNIKYSKHYEVYLKENIYYAVIYDYGDKILATKCCISDDKKDLKLFLNEYTIEDKKGILFYCYEFDNIFRYINNEVYENPERKHRFYFIVRIMYKFINKMDCWFKDKIIKRPTST